MDLLKALAEAEQAEKTNPGMDPPPERPRYTVWDLSFLKDVEPPAVYIVDQLIEAASVTVAVGDPGIGKSMAKLDMVCHVAGGLPWMGRTTRQVTCLIVDEETSGRNLCDRLRRIARSTGLEADGAVRVISLAQLKLDQAADVAILQAEISNTGAGLVLLDSFCDFFDGDENSKQDVQPALQNLRYLAESTGAAIVMLHHNGKSGAYRGSSTILATVDNLLKITSRTPGRLDFETQKMRYGQPQKFSAVMTWTDDTFFMTPALEVDTARALTRSQQYVMDYLKEHGPSTLDAIMGAADVCSPEAARKAVYNLATLKAIYRTNPGGRGVVGMYDLTPAKEEKMIDF